MTQDEINELIMRAYEVHAAADAGATEPLLTAFTNVTKSAKTYAFKHRLKSPRAIESKVRRKRSDGESAAASLDQVPEERRDDEWAEQRRKAGEDASYSADHVTDVLGCRFVTLYQSEIPLIVRDLLNALEIYNQDTANSPVDANEFVIYTNRPRGDPLSIVEETLRIVERSPLFRNVAATIRAPESRKSAYSSVHFVFKHDVLMQHPGRDEAEETAFFEVQIRDIFEEGWGEVQHDLLYSEKDKLGRPGGDHAEQRQWTLHLNALKTFVDGCSQHASIIKSNLDALRANAAPLTASQSVSERSADLARVVALLRRTSVVGNTLKLVARGYNLLMSADEVSAEGQRIRRLNDAAASLDEAFASLTQRQRDAKNRGETLTAGYYLQMEQAAARVSAAALLKDDEKTGRLAHAERIYEELGRRFSGDPTVKMRLGKVVESRALSPDDLTRSEALFDETIRLIRDDPSTGEDHWIAISSRIDKGVSIWKRGKLSGDLATLLDSLARAAEATASALAIWKQQSPSGNELNKVIGHKAASNIIYYLAMIEEEGGRLSSEQKVQLRETVDQVETYAGEPYTDWFKTRDNLLHAYRVLGEHERVHDLAKANFFEMRERAEGRAGGPLDSDQIRNHLAGSELVCFDAARQVVSAARAV